MTECRRFALRAAKGGMSFHNTSAADPKSTARRSSATVEESSSHTGRLNGAAPFHSARQDDVAVRIDRVNL
jgi:hypothetical protein